MPKKLPSLRPPGRPPAPTSAFGAARPKRPTRAGVNLGAAPGMGASPTPMQGASLNQPTVALKRGGGVHGHSKMSHHHDDERLHRSHGEHGHASYHGKSNDLDHSDHGHSAHEFARKHGGEAHASNRHTGGKQGGVY